MVASYAIAGERSPGNDLMGDGGPRDRREAREERRRDWFTPPWYQRPYYDPYYPTPRYVPRYVPRYNPWTLYDKCLWQYADTFTASGTSHMTAARW